MSGPNSVQGFCNPMDFQSGEHLVDGATLTVLLNPQQAQSGLKALAGGGAPGATPLIAGLNEVSTVTTTNDSCLLPYAVQGLTVTVVNDGVNSISVYPQQSNPNNAASAADTLVPLAGGTAASSAVAANAIVIFRCYKPGYWKASV